MPSLVSENIVAFVRGVAAEARRVETPCGNGHMVWHVWGDGPPLALLHGGYGSWTHWIRNVIHLSRTFTVAAPDLPGLGESATPPEPHTAEGLASIVVEGLEVVFPELGGLHIAGFSSAASSAVMSPRNSAIACGALRSSGRTASDWFDSRPR
jgi:pimeloyl-ACP methyl ester carboxylesterase